MVLLKEEILEYAAYAETNSNHPVAKSISDAYAKEIDHARIKTSGRNFGAWH